MDLNRVHTVRSAIPLRNALISVADKSGIDELVTQLWHRVPELRIYSTGGTYDRILAVAHTLNRPDRLHAISSYTGQPEMQGGLVKTLDYRIYLGLLSEEFNEAHQADLGRTGSIAFDLTVCNFYPFEEAAATPDANVEDLRTHIDIGGPTMLRASAKNFLRVAALCRPGDYPELVAELEANGGATTLAWRAARAADAFRYTAHYEAAIAGALGSHIRSANLDSIYTEASK